MSGDCEHGDVVRHGLDEVEVEAASAPFGPIAQRAFCLACECDVERHLRSDGWSPWRRSSDASE